MRKLFFVVLLLSLTGFLLSAYLLWLHYSPAGSAAAVSWLPCGDPASSCRTFAQSSWAEIYGIPVSSLGVFYYLWIAGLAAVLVFSGYISSEIVLGFLAVSVAGVIADAILGGVLVVTRNFCSLCVATYAVSFLILLCAAVSFRREVRRDSEMMEKSVDAVSGILHHRPRLFRLGLIGAYSGFCLLFVAAATFALSQYFESSQRGEQLVDRYVADFSAAEKIRVPFPESILVSGSRRPSVTIAVFSDPFCAPCRALYGAEQDILDEFGGSVRIDHYLLPLDPKCNDVVKGEGHPYSCVASANIVAAARLGFYDEFIRAHWDLSGKRADLYSAGKTPDAVLEGLLPRRPADGFSSESLSGATKAYIARDVRFAHSIGVRGTPTVFIGGKRLPSPVSEDNLRGVILFMLRNP